MAQMFRAITFTDFSEIPPDFEILKKSLRFLAYGIETCPTTDKQHFQGFAYSHKAMRFTGFKKLFPTAHIEQMKGNFRDNEIYCSKESKYTSFGEKPNQDGVKTSVLDVKRRLDSGERTMDIATDEGCFQTVDRSLRFFKEYENHQAAKRARFDRTMPLVYIRYGDSGTGKTRWLDEQYGLDGWRTMPTNNGQWFDGLDRSDVVLFDDIEASSCLPISLFLKLTDRYPHQVPVKGGFTTWKPKVIVFTSNHPWECWFPKLGDKHREAVKRRLFSVVKVYKDHEEVIYQNPDGIQETAQPVGNEECEALQEEPLHSAEAPEL
jgi:hypothetical protein